MLVAGHIITALQSIVARNVSPADTAVLSVTRVVAGDAYNVIPQTAKMSGTARAFKAATMQLLEQGMRRIAKGVAEGFGAEAEVDFRVIFAPLINAEAETDVLADAAAAVVGETNVDRAKPPSMGSEDFSFMMEKVPGAYIQVGNGDSAGAAQSGLQLQRRGDALRRGAAGDVVERQLGTLGLRRLPGAGAAPGNASDQIVVGDVRSARRP